MIRIERFIVNMIQENCYVVSDDTSEAVIIDCGAYFEDDRQRIQNYIVENSLKPTHLICTHGHFDHILGCRYIYEEYGCMPAITNADAVLYGQCDEQLLTFAGVRAETNLPAIGTIFDETSLIAFGQHALSIIPTPGHTPGGVSFYCKDEKVLFSGDSLFYYSIGRTDFPYGDEEMLISKLKENVISLPEDVIVYPGHGRHTTIAFEKSNNPYLRTCK